MSHDCNTGSSVQLIEVTCFFRLFADQLLLFNWSWAQVYFFIVKGTMSCGWFRLHHRVRFCSWTWPQMTSRDLLCTVVENYFWCVFCIHFNNSTKKTGHIINNLLTSFIRSLQGNLRPALDQRGQYVIAPGLRFPCNDLTLSLLGVFIGFWFTW